MFKIVFVDDEKVWFSVFITYVSKTTWPDSLTDYAKPGKVYPRFGGELWGLQCDHGMVLVEGWVHWVQCSV